MLEFICDKCGLCCQNLKNNPLYDDLHDGDGVCRHYDPETNLCRIYDHRPVKCNVKEAYQHYGFGMPYDEYLELNYKACKALKGEQ